MAYNLKKTKDAYNILNTYHGKNPYLIQLKNGCFASKKLTLNDFHIEYILGNHEKEPIYINKIVKIASWFGEKKQSEWNLEFTPDRLLITWFLGETETSYVFLCRYRKSLKEDVLCIASKKGILTDFLIEDYENKNIDFEKWNKLSGLTLKPQQERAIKFLTTRKKAILALQCGGGKTITAIVSALEDGYEKILVVCPASVKSTWKRELNYFVNDDEITIVDGNKWKENKFTVINYDILDNFYEIPTEIVKRKEKVVDENGKITYRTIEKEVVSKKQDVIKDAMENSQLFQSKFDLIIIDEAHRLSNHTSGRYKIMSDLINRSKPKGIYEITGTMITNNPKNLYNILKLIDADITHDWQHYMKTYCEGKQIYVKSERDAITKSFLKKVGKYSWYDLTYTEKNELNDILERKCRKIWLTNGASNLDELREKIKHLYLRENGDETKVKKQVIMKEYELNDADRHDYEDVWEEYVNEQKIKGNDKPNDYKSLIEGSILRQCVSKKMIPYTCKLVDEELNKGNKVIIACCFDNEVYEFQEIYGDLCVVYNGKMNRKQKDESEYRFMHDDDVRVFIGNIEAAGVGLTLISANVIVFNSVSWLNSSNTQMEYRIIRIGQEKECFIYYQKFKDTFLEHMFDILGVKQNITDSVIITEDEK